MPAHPGPGRRTLLQVGTGVGNGLRRALATMPSGGLLPKPPQTMTVTMSIPHSADNLFLLCLSTLQLPRRNCPKLIPCRTPYEIGSGFACCFLLPSVHA